MNSCKTFEEVKREVKSYMTYYIIMGAVELKKDGPLSLTGGHLLQNAA
ncbi:hypothetical protein [Paraliobacillus ryukyuensis]